MVPRRSPIAKCVRQCSFSGDSSACFAVLGRHMAQRIRRAPRGTQPKPVVDRKPATRGTQPKPVVDGKPPTRRPDDA